MQTVTQSVVTAKPVVVTSPTWALGFSDGCNGVSEFEAYGLFVGAKLADYLAGWRQGRGIRVQRWHVAFDDGKGKTGSYSTAKEQTPDRTKRIIDQVRYANSAEDRKLALQAAYYYCPAVYDCLSRQYE